MKDSQIGFTLIELMIVVAIIGILAAVAIPEYSRYIQRSANSACMAEAKVFMQGAIIEAFSDGEISTDFSNTIACQQNVTPALIRNAPIDRSRDYVFQSFLRGSVRVRKNISCSGSTGNCRFVNP